MTEFTCPMHPDIHETKAGSCPKCGMALEPETVSASIAHSQYTGPCTQRDGLAFHPMRV